MLADRVRHESFRVALQQAIRPGMSSVADIGAGTGVLAFFARELGAREVWLYDPGPALHLAELVAARNGIDGLHFVAERSLEVADPPRVDVVVAEVLGNFAYEEDVLETLRDAQRFLAPGGTLIPRSIVQWAAPVITDRFERDLAHLARRRFRPRLVGRRTADAQQYVRVRDRAGRSRARPARPGTRSISAARSTAGARGRAPGASTRTRTIYGFALWWECTLAPELVLSTSPHSPRTHWDQIYLPLLAPVVAMPGDRVRLDITSETGGAESGIEVRWTVRHEPRAGGNATEQSLSIGAGFLG